MAFRTVSSIPLLVACAFALAQGDARAQVVQPGTLDADTVVTGLSDPTAMAFLGPDDILVLQKNDGLVLRVVSGVLQPAAVLDVAVNASGERGLLGMALDPDFVNNRHVYLYYTEAAGSDGGTPLGNRVYRYTWDGNQLTAPRLVLDLPVTPGPNHDGGVIQFGPDDRLYVVIGDLGRDGQLQNFPTGPAPDDTSVILRVDRAGRGPVDNPLRDPANEQNPLNRYYAYGVRNSFGLAFDPLTGDLWDTENGEATMDEINRVVPGLNSGWQRIMGPESLSGGSQDELWQTPGSSYSDPEFSWVDTVAPTALTFVASRRLGCAFEHALLVGIANCGRVHRFTLNAARDGLTFQDPELQDLVTDDLSTCTDPEGELQFCAGLGVVTDIDNGPDGFIYLLSLDDGAIYRIRPISPVAGDLDGDLVPGSCDCDDGVPSAWADPAVLGQLRMSRGGVVQLGWDDLSPVAGPGTRYEVASGSLLALRSSGSFSAACALANGLATPTTTDARSNPPAGDAYYYLVRAENACSRASFGDSTLLPDPRDLLDASALPPCN